MTLELSPPRGESAVAVQASAHVQSSSPPLPNIKYHIDLSTDDGKTWKPLVKDWSITRRGDEPKDFWSQSFCRGIAAISATPTVGPIRVRFQNTGGKNYARGELHLVYRPARQDATKVTFAWADDKGEHAQGRIRVRCRQGGVVGDPDGPSRHDTLGRVFAGLDQLKACE